MHSLLSFRLPKYNKINEKIFNDDTITLTPFMVKPLFSLGYHHFIDRTREALSIVNKLDSKNEFYYVVNNFEPEISDYKDNIKNLTKVYINDIDKYFSKDFYKIWEILFIFDVINPKFKNIISLSYTSDKLNDDCVNCINKFSEKILNKDTSEFNFKKTKTDNNIDFIIAIEDSEIVKKNIKKIDNNKEQESYDLILEELLDILNLQKKNGNMILKIYDTFTMITLKIIYIICELYDEVYIYKPLLSRNSESEKFLICKNFKYSSSDKILSVIINKIKNILKEIKSSDKFLNDIFLNLEIPEDFINNFKFINTKIVNKQQILINEIVKYIKENNYFGDKYHNYRNNQIDSTKWWLNMFFPPSNNLYKISKDNIEKLVKSTNDKNNSEKEKLLASISI